MLIEQYTAPGLDYGCSKHSTVEIFPQSYQVNAAAFMKRLEVAVHSKPVA